MLSGVHPVMMYYWYSPLFYGVGAFYDVLPHKIVGDTDGVSNIPILTEIFKYGG